VHPVRKPAWQQATALVSLSTCGAMTGFTFAHGTVADMTSPASMPVRLMASNNPAKPASSSDSALRSAIVSVARYYLRMAQDKSPAEMEALIWQADSTDGVDHGESCAAFASLTLALGAQAVGQQSWVTGGGSYPWPLHRWADVRVETNPASPGVVSMLQDAQAHHRWHPLGDGYQPQPGDWVLFDGHVEVVTRYTGTALYTVGGDSLPSLTVNAHAFPAPFGTQGVLGFVNNGELVSAVGQDSRSGAGGAQVPGQPAQVPGQAAQVPGQAAQVPGQAAQVPGQAAQVTSEAGPGGQGSAAIPGTLAAAPGDRSRRPAESGGSTGRGRTAAGQAGGTAAIPGASVPPEAPPDGAPAQQQPAYGRHNPPPAAVPGTAVQQAFIGEVAPGAIAAQHRYGIPAAVTIAQAIDESGWGQSELAVADHNLFGIKGTGPAGTDMRPTQEYQDGIWVTRTASFRVYHNIAESIADHGRLLASGQAYQHAMADRNVPDAFAADLTGIYATDPNYGSNLIALMRLYNLYRYDARAFAPAQAGAPRVSGQQAAVPGLPSVAASVPGGLSVPGWPAAFAAASVRPAAAGRGPGQRPGARTAPRGGRPGSRPYVPQIPRVVTADFVQTAKAPLIRLQPLYQDVARRTGIPWELLAACDWMQCQAQPRHSPVRGEKLGTANPDGTVYRTKSAALAQCASDLIELAAAVYLMELAAPRALSVRELATVFAAFRWGGLLEAHDISAMEFPYSVAGLTDQHLKMRWPDIDDRYAPDKPGTRFRMPFGAVPVVLSLGYQAVA
jgi:flagellum-specific peptidoglycan hydrolase FlgJ